jgi:uncharacterized membrane protein YgcG
MHITALFATFLAFVLTAEAVRNSRYSKKKHTHKVQRAYLVSTEKMRHRDVAGYCKSHGGWPAVMDRQNLREARQVMAQKGVSEAYIGKRLGAKDKILKVVIDKKGRIAPHRSHGKRRIHALCQQEQKSDSYVSETSSSSSSSSSKTSSSSSGSSSSSSDWSSSSHRRSRKHKKSSHRHGRKQKKTEYNF